VRFAEPLVVLVLTSCAPRNIPSPTVAPGHPALPSEPRGDGPAPLVESVAGGPRCPETAWDGVRCVATLDRPAPVTPPPLARFDDIIRNLLTTPYVGSKEEVLRQYEADAHQVREYVAELQDFAGTCSLPRCVIAAIAREGSLYDWLAARLDGMRRNPPPRFTAKEQMLLQQLQQQQNAALELEAAKLSAAVDAAWSSDAGEKVAAARELAIERYAVVVAIAGRNGLKGAEVSHALRRLADFTVAIGEPALRAIVLRTRDPNDPARTLEYREGMYLR
jgi:hypothetical protein